MLRRYPLGNVTGDGWLKEDLSRLAKGMGGWNQNAIDPFWQKTATDWESEFLCKALLGQVLLGWTSGDPDIRNRAASNIEKIVSSPFRQADGYLGFAQPAIRNQDYLGWPANQEIRALLLFYEANPSRTDVRDAARDYALWFARNWDRKVYADKANSYRYESARPGHGYVGLCVVDAVLEVNIARRKKRFSTGPRTIRIGPTPVRLLTTLRSTRCGRPAICRKCMPALSA